MEHLKLKNSLKQHDFVFSLIKKVKMKVMEIENYEQLKLNQELTKHISNCIEEEMKTSLKEKVNKKEILIQIIQEVFTLSEDELKTINDQVVFLLDNNHIKKKNLLKNILRLAKSVIVALK